MPEIYSQGEFKLWEGKSVGETRTDYSTIGLIKSGVSAVSKATKPKIGFELTNKRALVIQTQGAERQILQECALNGATVSVLNRTKEGRNSIGYSFRASMAGRIVDRTIALGDVVFFSNGRIGAKFQRIEDPDGVRNLAQKAMASSQGA